MKICHQIKLFLSSPSDVMEERNAAVEIINEINRNDGKDKGYFINVYRWEKDFTPDWGEYQPQINKELIDTDIFVGILWNRFGTPTENYLSGTCEEFEEANSAKVRRNKIELCFYRCTKNDGFNSNNQECLNQKMSVVKFFEDNKRKFSPFEYEDISEFKTKLREDILKKTQNLLELNTSILNFEELVKSFNKNGITKLYTPELNDIRNSDKVEFLQKEDGEIYLLAHSGNSYLHTSEDGNCGRFFNDFKNRLMKKQNKAKILLLNPYSLEARKIFYAENFNLYKNDITTIKDVAVLERGKNFLRFSKCLEGIRLIQNELGEEKGRIEVKISNVATDGTILMSNDRLFFEPYISSRFLKRIERGLTVFEIQVKNLLNRKQCSSVFSNKNLCDSCVDKVPCSENLYKTIAEQFHILWATSISLAEYKGQNHIYKKDFMDFQPNLFKKQLVQLHDSWYAFDPIIGCKGNCVYCFLNAQGWNNSKPELRNRPNENEAEFLKKSYKSLIDYKYFGNKNKENELGKIPISIGNKTDILSSKNRRNLLNILDLHKNGQTNRPLVLITKQEIKPAQIEMLRKYDFDINILYSISFLSREFEPNVPSYKTRLESAKLINEKLKNDSIQNIHLIHYWRPIINLVNENIDSIIRQIKEYFECSVCVGLKINPEIYDFIESNSNNLKDYLVKKGVPGLENGVEIFEPSMSDLKMISGNNNYSMFQHTSCALSFVQKKADYNGSMWRENFCIGCEPDQIKRCKSFKDKWEINNYLDILNHYVGSNYKINEDCIEITEASISQEKLNFLTHLIGKPVFSKSIRFSLVWPSSNQIYFRNKYSKLMDNYEVR